MTRVVVVGELADVGRRSGTTARATIPDSTGVAAGGTDDTSGLRHSDTMTRRKRCPVIQYRKKLTEWLTNTSRLLTAFAIYTFTHHSSYYKQTQSKRKYTNRWNSSSHEDIDAPFINRSRTALRMTQAYPTDGLL